MLTQFFWSFGIVGLFLLSSCAHHWKGTPESASGIINHYAAVVDFDGCSDIEVDNASKFSSGDLVLIIQMQGAEINGSNVTSYGQVTSYGSAGLYEFGRVEWISGNHIWLRNKLVNVYDLNGSLQIVYVPEYKNVKISGPLTCAEWDGKVGGVLVLRASGTVMLEADINVDFKGFRGGITHEQNIIVPNYEGGFVGTDLQKYSAKGEGIAGFGQGVQILGRGAPANGGGGGGNHNAGGGGGANGGCGGNGGYSYQHSRYSGNYKVAQGIGAKPLATHGNRLFLGGGGGAGHSNNLTGSDGGNGGGIVLVQAERIVGKDHTIRASGQGTHLAKYDGVGGAGAGGTIALHIKSVHGDLRLDVSGGNGGSTYEDVEHKGVGPGGGGGGGVIRSTAWSSDVGTVIPVISGGANGLTIRNDNYGAETGCEGQIFHKLEIPEGKESCLPIEDFKVEEKGPVDITETNGKFLWKEFVVPSAK